MKDTPLRVTEGARPCPRLDFGLPAPRMEVVNLPVLEPKEKETGQDPRALSFWSKQGL